MLSDIGLTGPGRTDTEGVAHDGDVDRRWPCPCCGFRTLSKRNAYELCPVCYWEDDPHQANQPKSPDGANAVSLIAGQRAYARMGAMADVFRTKVRQPRKDEGRDPGWRPIGLDSHA